MKKYLLFDFDGVIADSYGLAFEINKMICPRLSEKDYRRRFDGNINDWEDPVNGHTKECRHGIDFFAEYIPRMEKEVKIVPGIKEAIIALEKNYFLVVVSSTITSPIQNFLEKAGLADHFAKILGNDIHQSKVEKIKMVFERYGIIPDDCVFITDTLGDMREAAKMGVGAIAVTWGFHFPKTLRQGKPFRIVEKPSDLITAAADYFETLE